MSKKNVLQIDDKFASFKGTVREELPAGHYRLRSSISGMYYEEHPIDLAEAVFVPGGRSDLIIKRMHAFFSPEVKERYARVNARYARNVLMYGAPGTGKTMIVRQLAAHVVEQLGGIVLWDVHPELMEKTHFAISPDRLVMVVAEEIDQYFPQRGEGYENELLSFLDGSDSKPNTLVVATTNYIDKLPPRVYRDGRFDERLEIGAPNEAERLGFLAAKYSMLPEATRTAIADAAKDVPISKLAAVVKRVYCFDEPMDKAIKAVLGE